MKTNHLIGSLAVCLFGLVTLCAQPAKFEFRADGEALDVASEKRKVSLTECGGTPCLLLAGSSKWAVELDPAKFAGRTVYLSCEFKTEGISVRPEKKNTHGFKAQLFVVTAENRKLYFHKLPVTGTCGWKTVRQKIAIPAGSTRIVLSVSSPDGRVLVKHLSLAEKAAVKTPATEKPDNVQTLDGSKKKVTVDGIFSPGEWSACASDHVFISQTTGQKALRDTFIYYGYDRDHFYFCQLGALPKQPQKLDPADTVELVLTTPEKKTFRFSFTPQGGAALPAGVLCRSDMCGKLVLGNGLPTSPRWVLEAAIPWSALGMKSAPENAEFQMRVRRLWRNPAETAELAVPRLYFSRSAPAVSITRALYGLNARISGKIANPSAESRSFDLDIMIRSQEVPHRANQRISVKGGATASISQYFMVGGAADRNLDITLKDTASGRVLYARNADWNVRTGTGFFDPDPPITMNFGFSPSQNRLIAKVESASPAKFSGTERIEFKVVSADGVVMQKVRAEKRAPGFYFKDWRCPELPLGTYTLEAELFGKNGRTGSFRRSFRIMNFDWQNTRVGMERKVPSPFRPLKSSDNEVHALLTGYRTAGVFWDRIFAQKENILAGPVTLIFNGKPLKTDHEEWIERSPDRAVRLSGHSADGLKLRVKHEYEFDGMCRTTLAFQPEQNLTVDSLYIDMPLKPEIARLYHHTGFGIRSNPSAWIPQGSGRVWSLPWAMLKYPSCLWFGEIFKGLSFFSDMTPPFFDNRTGFVSHEILRSKDKVTLRVHLAPPGRTAFKPFEYVCGFQPTPVKPRPKGFRQYGGSMWTAKPPGVHMIYAVAWNKHFFSHISFGQPLVPYANDPAFLEYIFSGRQDRESRDQIMTRIGALLKKHDMSDKKWSALFGDGHDSSSLTARMRQGAIFTRNKERGLYLNPRAGYRCWAESEMYDDEWMHSGYRDPDDSHYHRHPVCSYADMLLFKTRAFLRRYPGCRGVYFDNLYPGRMASLFWGARELAPGKNSFTGDIFFMRELVKRTLVMSEQEKRFLSSDPRYAWLVGHMTDANIVPVMGLLSVTLGWEMKFGRRDYQERFPEPFHLVQSLGTQTGTVPIGIAFTGGTEKERARQHRTLYAAGFAFDMLNFWDPGSREEDGSPLFNSMQKLVRGFGYGTEEVEHFPGYEPEKNPVKCLPDHIRVTTLKRKDGRLMLLVGNLGEAAEVKLRFSGIRVSGLRNAETGKEIVNAGFGLPEHDCAVLTGKWSREQ